MSGSRKAVTAILAALIIMTFAAGQASAQTCGFTISNMNFGSDIDTLSGSAVDTTATLAYNCSGGDASARVLICANLGEGSVAAAGNARRMAGGGSHLLYQLYQSSEHTVIWGSADTANPPPPIVAILDGSGAASDSRTIYGRLFGGQSTAEATAYTSSFSGTDVDIRYRVTDDNDCSGGSGTSGGAVSFDVNATVAEKCLVSTVPVNFGSHSTLSTNIDASGSVSVTCTPATSYAIRLNGGNAAAAPIARKMFKGLETITYGLYQNSERNQPWGDTEGTTVTGTGSGGVQAHTVYGRVAPQTTPPVGTYTDTVIVVVDY